jgi:hypothetical protein
MPASYKRVGKLNREAIVSLLKEIMCSCNSFHSVQAVSISKNEGTQDWTLKAKWELPKSEKECLNKLMLKYGVKVLENDGFTVFYKPTVQP